MCGAAGDATLRSCPTPALSNTSSYYLRIYSNGGYSGSYSIKITTEDFTEGSVASPVKLDLGGTHTGSVNANSDSFYYFTTPELPGDYTITLDNQVEDLGIRVYSTSAFSGQLIWCSIMASGDTCTVTGLEEHTSYYIRVEGDYYYDVPSFDIGVTAPVRPGCTGGGECYDLEGGAFPAEFANSVGSSVASAAGWYVEGAMAANGAYSLRTEPIGNSEDACFDYSPAIMTNTVSFNFRTDTELNNDFLVFTVDGTDEATWSGLNYWSQHTYFTNSAAALHTYSWCYIKDNNFVAGEDAAWVDDINAY
jgi:hypothetical protein